ncbi:MAG: hypothetical protein IJ058_13805 [Lachnospiraceae bacterium]|nr:hypothetical protein [Lachnospiraceae bacterium]MBQ8947854.1 hypothetical protein [Lachnospiraceae bacterium]
MKLFERRLNAVLLTIYLFLICFSFCFVFVTDRGLFLLVISIVLIPVLFVVSNAVLNRISRLNPIAAKPKSDRQITRSFFAATVSSFVILMIWFAAFRPGSFQGDCINQVGQALSGEYDDWHPVWQTILFYTLPLKLTGGKFWAMTFFQMLWFSLVMGYLIRTIYKYAGKWWAAGIWAYIMLNPYTGQMLLYPWKDNAFTMAGTIAFIMAVEICLSHGKWADKWWKCVLLGIMMANCTIFRHNAIALTAFLVIGLFFFMDRIRWIQMLIGFMAFFAMIKGPVYGLLHVQRTPQPVVQAVGLPMAMIGNVVVETPERLDDEVADFAYRIAPREIWERDYEMGNFGVMKYYGEVNLEPIEEAGTAKVFGMALNCIKTSPAASLKAAFALTDIVYGPDIKDEGYIGTQIIDNNYGIMYQGNGRLAGFLELYYKLVRLHGLNYTRQFAFCLLILTTVILGRADLHSADERKMLIVVLSIYAYSFGTMLLLTSADSRFFYVDYLICPLAVIMMMSKRGDNVIIQEK